MTTRPRTSTLVIIGLFFAVLALYILVRPVPAGMVQTRSTKHAHVRPKPTTPVAPARPLPVPPSSHSPIHPVSPTHTASPSPSGTPAPSQTQTPTPGTTPTPTQVPSDTPSAPIPSATTSAPGAS